MDSTSPRKRVGVIRERRLSLLPAPPGIAPTTSKQHGRYNSDAPNLSPSENSEDGHETEKQKKEEAPEQEGDGGGEAEEPTPINDEDMVHFEDVSLVLKRVERALEAVSMTSPLWGKDNAWYDSNGVRQMSHEERQEFEHEKAKGEMQKHLQKLDALSVAAELEAIDKSFQDLVIAAASADIVELVEQDDKALTIDDIHDADWIASADRLLEEERKAAEQAGIVRVRTRLGEQKLLDELQFRRLQTQLEEATKRKRRAEDDHARQMNMLEAEAAELEKLLQLAHLPNISGPELELALERITASRTLKATKTVDGLNREAAILDLESSSVKHDVEYLEEQLEKEQNKKSRHQAEAQAEEEEAADALALAAEEAEAREQEEAKEVKELERRIGILQSELKMERQKLHRLKDEQLPEAKAEHDRAVTKGLRLDKEVKLMNCLIGKSEDVLRAKRAEDESKSLRQASEVDRKKRIASHLLDKLSHILEEAPDDEEELDDETESAIEDMKTAYMNAFAGDTVEGIIDNVFGDLHAASKDNDAEKEEESNRGEEGSDRLASVAFDVHPSALSSIRERDSSERNGQGEEQSLNAVLIRKLMDLLNTGYFAESRKLYLERRLAAALGAADQDTIDQVRAKKLGDFESIVTAAKASTDEDSGDAVVDSERARMLSAVQRLQAERQMWSRKIEEEQPKRRDVASMVRTASLVQKAKSRFRKTPRRALAVGTEHAEQPSEEQADQAEQQPPHLNFLSTVRTRSTVRQAQNKFRNAMRRTRMNDGSPAAPTMSSVMSQGMAQAAFQDGTRRSNAPNSQALARFRSIAKRSTGADSLAAKRPPGKQRGTIQRRGKLSSGTNKPRY